MLSIKSEPKHNLSNDLPKFNLQTHPATDSTLLPITDPENSQSGMEITLKMTGALVLFIAAHLVFPRVADLTSQLKLNSQHTRQAISVSHQDVRNKEMMSEPSENQTPFPTHQTQSQSKYKPTNFGAPNSNRGSGSR